MYIAFIIDFISILLLIGASNFIWKQRLRFYSLAPLLPAIVFIGLGRFCDMLVEHPSIRLSSIFGLSPDSFELLFSVAGNITDVIGISILIYGFIKIINFEAAEEKRIKELEKMLPLCANCKKYRTEENQWFPIEEYLVKVGASTVTHGICPECAKLLYGDILKNK